MVRFPQTLPLLPYRYDLLPHYAPPWLYINMTRSPRLTKPTPTRPISSRSARPTFLSPTSPQSPLTSTPPMPPPSTLDLAVMSTNPSPRALVPCVSLPLAMLHTLADKPPTASMVSPTTPSPGKPSTRPVLPTPLARTTVTLARTTLLRVCKCERAGSFHLASRA